MPTEPITIDTTIVAVGEVEPSWGNVLLIGEDEGGGLAVNTVTKYTTLAAVGTDFGTTSKVYYAATMLVNQGVASWYGVKVDVSSVVAESIAGNTNTAFANSPVKGGTVVIAAYTIEYDFNNPPTDPGVNKGQVGAEGTEIFVNSVGPHSTNYDYYDLTSLTAELANYERTIDIIYFCAWTDGSGNGGFSAQDWGIGAEMVDYADLYRWIAVIPGRGDEIASVQVTDLTCNGETSLESQNVFLIAHLDTTVAEDVGAAVAGKISVTVPWDKLMWKVIKGLTDATVAEFTKTQVDTFETNKINALISKQSAWRPSDGLTSIGGTDYKFIDITRTRYYMEENITFDLEVLIANNPLPYDQGGIQTVQEQIGTTCQRAVEAGALRQPFIDSDGDYKRGYDVEVPLFSDVSSSDITARLLDNITVTIRLAGHIQTITLNLAIILG